MKNAAVVRATAAGSKVVNNKYRLSTNSAPSGQASVASSCVFSALCEARALLWANYQFDLHDAVDGSWAIAGRSGLVRRFGADHVQELMAAAFRPYRTTQAST